jgi:predicted DNA-binding protein (UPF0251 family)
VARPEKIRRVGCVAGGRAFKPIGRPVGGLEIEDLRLDELEALRLAVSRPTFARILARARSAVARALIEERVLVVGEGPVVTASDEPFPCPVHDGGRRRGQGCRCRQQQGRSGRGRGPR